jgi:four helix bundle protein
MSAPEDLRSRTKKYALRVIRLFRALPRRDAVAEVLGKQLLRSATSVAAHYREACRAKSDLDFISKLEGAQQELDESDLWLELLAEANIIAAKSGGAIRCPSE